ncbi:hypothetical protein PENSPDRAFT_642045 [Peniophora sp. CONT]|nr:hypothetical protein PENSPDRAFT_642045 [Peniophora sp. CONT]
MPQHWRNDYSSNIQPQFLRPILRVTFTVFSIIAFGQPTLETQWRIINDAGVFTQEKERLSKMVGTVNVVVFHFQATLLLATTAAFITTDPPEAGILNYTRRGPYICLIASFFLFLGGIIVGCAVQFALTSCTSEWIRDTLMGTRFRVWTMMLLLGYPFMAIAVAASVNIIGQTAPLLAHRSSLTRSFRPTNGGMEFP